MMTTTFGWYEIGLLFVILFFITLYMQLQTLAYVTDKAVRIAPVATFVLIFNCLIDFMWLGTVPSIY